MTNTIKRMGWAMVLAVGWLGAGGLAEASCAESTILLAVPGSVIGEAVSVAWAIEPACDVVETGLLLGPSPTALAPVGQPIYGARTAYRLALPLPESGFYWIGAWARDEEGTRLQAAAQPVLVIMPPPVPGEPTGSHAPGARDPASYTGTDADFLRPAASLANPRHFASLRFGFSEHQQRSESRVTGTFFPFIFAATVRRVGSTHPDEVRAAQREPFTLLGEPEPVLLEPVTPGGGRRRGCPHGSGLGFSGPPFLPPPRVLPRPL